MGYTALSFVFGEQPSAAKFNLLPANDASFNDGTGIGNDVITDTKLVYGKLRSRQGGSATNWSTAGSTTYDYSATNVFVQVGSKAINANPTTITFPTAFNQVPIVLLSTSTAGAANSFPVQTSTPTATTATVRLVNDGGTAVTTESVFWMAIGE